MTSNLPDIFVYKYKIGDKFYNDHSMVEITGYNHVLSTYRGKLTFKKSDTTASLELMSITEKQLNQMGKMPEHKESLLTFPDKVRYRIYYFDSQPPESNKVQKAEYITIGLSGIRALAKMLNSMVKRNENRRITLVCIVDENDKYITHVKFLRQEIEKQYFLTGMKERLLAHAKYERGYELATGF